MRGAGSRRGLLRHEVLPIMSFAGAYSLHVYCDGEQETPSIGTDQSCKRYKRTFVAGPDEFTGRTHAQCVRQAKKRGWRFKRDGRTVCAECSK